VRFSVIIPTRNRAAYLQHCIQSCLTQEESADEILVCDNSSPEQAAHTQRVVNDFSSFNVRYLPPDARPLNMTDNWNRAIQAAVGDYVTVLGDDDGLTPACIRCLPLGMGLLSLAMLQVPQPRWKGVHTASWQL
jgi:glycosyltransferase involved in cell wall biosynthesis